MTCWLVPFLFDQWVHWCKNFNTRSDQLTISKELRIKKIKNWYVSVYIVYLYISRWMMLYNYVLASKLFLFISFLTVIYILFCRMAKPHWYHRIYSAINWGRIKKRRGRVDEYVLVGMKYLGIYICVGRHIH